MSQNLPDWDQFVTDYMYDNMVREVSVKPGENMAFKVKSESFANSQKIIFEMAWQQAKLSKLL